MYHEHERAGLVDGNLELRCDYKLASLKPRLIHVKWFGLCYCVVLCRCISQASTGYKECLHFSNNKVSKQRAFRNCNTVYFPMKG